MVPNVNGQDLSPPALLQSHLYEYSACPLSVRLHCNSCCHGGRVCQSRAVHQAEVSVTVLYRVWSSCSICGQCWPGPGPIYDRNATGYQIKIHLSAGMEPVCDHPHSPPQAVEVPEGQSRAAANASAPTPTAPTPIGTCRPAAGSQRWGRCRQQQHGQRESGKCGVHLACCGVRRSAWAAL